MERELISEFSGDYSFLSNFYRSSIKADNIVWPTAEHFFQGLKSCDRDERLAISRAPTPGVSKRLGRQVSLPSNWNDIRVDVMRMVVRFKFEQNPELVLRLRATGDAYLVEGNTWHDQFWGAVRNHKGRLIGKNWLGRILVAERGYHNLKEA